MKFLILQWCKEHSTQLSIMTIKQSLALLLSIVDVKKTFSMKESILDQIHLSMFPESVEA